MAGIPEDEIGHWYEVAKVDDMPDQSGREVVAGNQLIGLFRIGENWHAIDGTCPHHGGPLGQGCLNGEMVTCPWHGLEVNVRTGDYHLAAESTLRTFETRIADGVVFVRVTDEPQ